MMATAHVCYGNYLPAMGITFTLHTHGDVYYRNYFLFKKNFPFYFFLKNTFFKSKKMNFV